MPVLVICEFVEAQIKIKTDGVSVETSFSPLYVNGSFLLPWQPHFQRNLHALEKVKYGLSNNQGWVPQISINRPDFKLFQHFRLVLIICKFDKSRGFSWTFI